MIAILAYHPLEKKIPDQTEEMCYLHNDDSVWKLPIALHTHTYTLSPIHTDDYDDDGDDASSDDFESDDDGHMWLHS